MVEWIDAGRDLGVQCRHVPAMERLLAQRYLIGFAGSRQFIGHYGLLCLVSKKAPPVSEARWCVPKAYWSAKAAAEDEAETTVPFTYQLVPSQKSLTTVPAAGVSTVSLELLSPSE
jgi:hypothetical protein